MVSTLLRLFMLFVFLIFLLKSINVVVVVVVDNVIVFAFLARFDEIIIFWIDNLGSDVLFLKI